MRFAPDRSTARTDQAKGVRLPLSDLLIGITALELDYGVATANLRHFQMIPGLKIVSL